MWHLWYIDREIEINLARENSNSLLLKVSNYVVLRTDSLESR